MKTPNHVHLHWQGPTKHNHDRKITGLAIKRQINTAYLKALENFNHVTITQTIKKNRLTHVQTLSETTATNLASLACTKTKVCALHFLFSRHINLVKNDFKHVETKQNQWFCTLPHQCASSTGQRSGTLSRASILLNVHFGQRGRHGLRQLLVSFPLHLRVSAPVLVLRVGEALV